MVPPPMLELFLNRISRFSVYLMLLCWSASGCAGGSSSKAGRESPTNPADSDYAVAPADTTWPDPAPHRNGYAFSGRVRIHYLDFGGSGEPLVFLTGLGSSAHVFDDLAPRFTDRFRVIALTRRGHAQSDHPRTGYALDTLVADIKAVLDTLVLRRVHLAGHSIAGGELSRFAIVHPNRVASLIYIDAMLHPAGLERLIDEDTIKVMATEADFETYESGRAWFQRCFFGFWSPALEADFRINTTASTTTDTIFRDAVRSPAWLQDYSRIHAPALVIYTFATLERRRPCVAGSPDQERANRARAFLNRRFRPHQLAGIDLFIGQMPKAKMVELKGHHFLFISNQDEVVKEMRQFLLHREP
jgi:pimeloyl-ACP methyl ester carboxylesterase